MKLHDNTLYLHNINVCRSVGAAAVPNTAIRTVANRLPPLSAIVVAVFAPDAANSLADVFIAAAAPDAPDAVNALAAAAAIASVEQTLPTPLLPPTTCRQRPRCRRPQT